MKSLKYIILAIAGGLFINSCVEEAKVPGNPVMEVKTQISSAYFGDSLSFTINASDEEVPLSTLKARLYFSEELVSETVIRTKDNGADYTGKIYIPFLANIPDGTAKLKFVLQNINFTITEVEYDLALTRPEFPYLTLVTDTEEYRMEPVAGVPYEYSVTSAFSPKVEAYIVAPKMGESGNEITFGAENNVISEGLTSNIMFSSVEDTYAITFNTLTYAASPFIKLIFNGTEMSLTGESSYAIDMDFTQNQTVSVDIPYFEEYWIDPDYFALNSDGTLTFLPIDGRYRVIAHTDLAYLEVLMLNGSETAVLNSDGSGALWIIGEGIGKPNLQNAVGWTTEKGLCMPQIEPLKYQMTLVGGEQIKTNEINFKFFHQQGWGGEFTNATLTSNSNMIFVGDGENGRDPGNLGLVEGTALEAGATYKLTVDMSAGIEKAVLSFEKIGESTVVPDVYKINGQEMTMIDQNTYNVTLDLTQGEEMIVEGIDNLTEYWIDPDFFAVENGSVKFLPVAGSYRITAHLDYKFFGVEMMDGEETAKLKDDGTGALWVLGWGIGKPNWETHNVNWSESNALLVSQISPSVHQITLVAGEQLTTEKLEIKFFHQAGWGGECNNKDGNSFTTESDFVMISEGGDVNLAAGQTLEEGVAYRFTVDLTAGKSNGVLTVEKL